MFSMRLNVPSSLGPAWSSLLLVAGSVTSTTGTTIADTTIIIFYQYYRYKLRFTSSIAIY